MERGGKRGYFEEEEAFFSRGESPYKCIRPCFLGGIHVCGEKRKGLYVRTSPKQDLIFRRRCAELITGNPYFSSLEKDSTTEGIGDLQ